MFDLKFHIGSLAFNVRLALRYWRQKWANSSRGSRSSRTAAMASTMLALQYWRALKGVSMFLSDE